MKFLRPLEIEGQAKQRERLESFAVDLLPKPMQSCFIQQFGEDFPRLCNEEAVSPDSESLQVLKNTQVCDSSKVDNDAVGEEEATHRASEAAMQYAARRVEAQTLQRTRPRVPRASSTLSVHGWTEFTEPATPAGYAEKGQDPLQQFWVPSSII